MKILILRFSSIGDIVLTTPVVRCLKEQLPEVEIHYVTKPQYAGILEDNPYIDKVITLQGSISSLAKSLRSEKYTAVVDLHANLRTRLLRTLLPGVSFQVFRKQNLRKWMLVKKLTRKPCEHVVLRFLETVKKWGVTYDGRGLDFFMSDAHLPDGLPVDFIAYAIGGTWGTKRMPEDKMLELINRLEKPVVLLGDKNDSILANRLTASLNAKVVNLCGQLSLQQSARVIDKASHLISHDTGLMHIGAALNKHIISIWGNTTPDFGMAPFFPSAHSGNKDLIVEVEGLACRPCSKIGFDACPHGHFKCMNNQDFSEIGAKI